MSDDAPAGPTDAPLEDDSRGAGSSAVPEGTVAQRVAEAEDKPELALTQDEAADLKRGQEFRRGEQDIRNRRRIANWAIGGMVFQLVVANGVFIAYALTMGSKLDVGALQVWLGTTVVQIIGVVLVITQYLFPPSGRQPEERP